MPSHRLKPAVATWSSPPPSVRKKTCCCPGLRGSKPHGRFYRDTTSEGCLSLGSLAPRLQDVSFLKHFPGYFPRASVASEGTSGPWAIWIETGDQALYQLSYSASRSVKYFLRIYSLRYLCHYFCLTGQVFFEDKFVVMPSLQRWIFDIWLEEQLYGRMPFCRPINSTKAQYKQQAIWSAHIYQSADITAIMCL